MATSAELVFKVGNWANRDDLFDNVDTSAKTATSAVILDFLEIAQKRINNTLRIPPMEQLNRETVSATGNDLTIPADMIEPIYIRTVKTDTDGNESTGLVYNAKVGSRNFADSTASGGSTLLPTYSRRANKYTFNPPLGEGDVVELYYYRVLPDLDGVFPADEVNCLADNVEGAAAGENASFAGDVCTSGTVAGTGIIGDEVPQWFRDEAEEVLLYGALAELFAYLGEEMDQERWFKKFEDKLRELREEEAYREWRGGTIVTNIITNGLI